MLGSFAAQPALAQVPTIAFTDGVVIETGDTWSHAGQKYRLYGVQACIRGTTFSKPSSEIVDCGGYSIASLAALFATQTVACQPIGAARDSATIVVCAARIGEANVDVGTALIASGAAFAAIYPSSVPVVSAYLVAELSAKQRKEGLWAGQFEHPAKAILDDYVQKL